MEAGSVRTLDYLENDLVVTDGGLETTPIFREGIDLPHFAAFILLKDESGREMLRNYYLGYLEIAASAGKSIILETATWRANPDWGKLVGYAPEEVDEVNRRSVGLLDGMKGEFERSGRRLLVSGCVGPRGDGYVSGDEMNREDARAYHYRQISVFKEAGADLVTGITMTYENEAIGIADAAAESGIPCVISFTVETNGRLPNGAGLRSAIRRVDNESIAAPAYYMINCAHPTHFLSAIEEGEGWRERIRGTRVNASKMSHAELDKAEELDDGDPSELASEHLALRNLLPNLTVVGGCCGTDERHVGAIVSVLAGSGGDRAK